MDKKRIINGILIFSGIVFGSYGLYKGISSREPVKYSLDWISRLTDQEWENEREIVRQKFCCPEYSTEVREDFKRILNLFDKVKSERDWAGKKPQGPAFRREHGWYL